MNILIVKLSAIGDVIHTLPALNAIRKYRPDARITWVVEDAAASLIQGHESLDRVLVSGRKRWIKGLVHGPGRLKNTGHILNFFKELRDTRYDLVIDFQQLLKSGALVGLSRGKCKAGFDRGMAHMEESHLFLNRRIPPVSMEIHALERYLMLVRALGIPADTVEYRLPVTNQDRAAVDRMLEQHGIFGEKSLIAINPMAQWPTKLWKNQGFAEIADRLVSDYNTDVVFTGGPDDRPLVRDIASRMQTKIPDFTGRTTLKMLAALYEKARCVISTDTGPMHLSAAVETTVVALFGPTAPWRTGPFGLGHEVIRTGIECSPCFKRSCVRNDFACMTGITAQDVLDRVERLGIHPVR